MLLFGYEVQEQYRLTWPRSPERRLLIACPDRRVAVASAREGTAMQRVGSMIACLLTGRDAQRRRLRQGVIHAVAIAVVALSGPSALSQAARTIKIVVPAPPGGAGDVLARMVAEQVAQAQGQTMTIENRPGAGTIIGTEAVAHAAPDGNTLLLTSPALLINPHLRKVSYDPLAGFEPICCLVSSPGVIVVNAASPYRTLGDLLDAARRKPGEVTFASAGPATTHHIGLEILKRVADASFVYVPYSGGAPAINALLGGHVTAVLAEYAPLAEHVKAGKLRALATTARARIASLPDLPAAAETFKGYEVDFWWGLFAPARTPKDTVAQVSGWFSAALQASHLRGRLVAQGFDPVATCGADFAALLRQQYEEYGRVIRETRIKAD
jgi:tripartite-type tricarboxylate transporter receptor subunit TctC